MINRIATAPRTIGRTFGERSGDAASSISVCSTATSPVVRHTGRTSMVLP